MKKSLICISAYAGITVALCAPRVYALNQDELDSNLIKAAREADAPMMRRLLEKGADPDAIDAQSPRGETPLIYAVLQNRTDIVKILFDYGADPDAPGEEERTPLFYATALGNHDMIRLLVKNDADINMRDKTGSTPVMLAAINADVATVTLLAALKADINMQDYLGMNAVMYAASQGNTNVIQALASLKADLNMQSIDGQTALIIAAYFGHADAVKMLIQNGADIDITDNQGTTAFDAAKDKETTDIIAAEMLKKAQKQPNIPEEIGDSRDDQEDDISDKDVLASLLKLLQDTAALQIPQEKEQEKEREIPPCRYWQGPGKDDHNLCLCLSVGP